MRARLALIASLCCLANIGPVGGQSLLLRPDAVFDGVSDRLHPGWVVLVDDDRIVYAGPATDLRPPRETQTIELRGLTLLPGLIEGHSHLFLHPYNETSWNDQVLFESLAERVARATAHARATLMAGVTTTRDLGTEGAGYADVGLKRAIDRGITPGPRMVVTTRAIAARGSYGPKGAPEHDLPKGAEMVDGPEHLVAVVRDQIGRGADWIKVYADYRWGPSGEARPTFSEEELRTIVQIAESSGRAVVAHAATPEGMRRATMAGVRTIEHGDGGTADVFALMAEHGVVFCPTLAAVDAITQYGGWRKGVDPEPARVRVSRSSFQLALQAGVDICFGGDVGVYAHGDNVRELELMVEYGMPAIEATRAATGGNAKYFGLSDRLGAVQEGLLADLIGVAGDPTQHISVLRNVRFVMKGGQIVRHD